MPFTDAQGRLELLMHPDILRGEVAYRRESASDDSDAGPADRAPAAASAARPAATGTRSGESTSTG
ncbi:hypothetical protein SAMN05660350_04955 [Geodermatophilus obscurus]|uniref:Uncharacterized protein n=1 Tax=Geodermatophilus obscurus TaxID=1861 RepID=A0A1M7V136_9ACTN|nr:hypothetical protein [Geodermatophilus obscurus]SHN88963.1 hypothetical protein SAMN05660350_04955 [Geodermatophilus obscurus]